MQITRAHTFTFVIPGCAVRRRPGIHTPCRGYGFRARDGACHRAALRADPLVAPRNDGESVCLPRNNGDELLPQPFRRALFRKCLRPLDVILRGRHRLHRGILALFGDCLFQRDREALLDRLLGGADRHRAVLADGLCPAFRRRQGFAWRTTSLTNPSS